MKYQELLLIAALFTTQAFAEPTYLLNGKPVEAKDAIVASLRGGNVLKCTPVETHVNKSGTSLSLRTKKVDKESDSAE